MKNESLPHYVTVEQPFGLDPKPIHCPICGQAAMQEGKDGMWETTPCNHLTFIFANEVSEFEYMDPEFKERFTRLSPKSDKQEEIDDDHWHYDTSRLPEILAKAGYGKNLVIIERTCGGMGCGPVWFTNLFAFNWNKMLQDSQETPDSTETKLKGSRIPE